MSSVIQRRTGEWVTLYTARREVSARGAPMLVVDPDSGVKFRCTEQPERSSRAELPGQLGIEMVRIDIPWETPASLWGAAYFRDGWWDVQNPPAVLPGSRHVRHKQIVLRRRPGPPEGMVSP